MDKHTARLSRLERQELFLIALNYHDGHISDACRDTGIVRATFRKWIERNQDNFAGKYWDVIENNVDDAERVLYWMATGKTDKLQTWINQYGKEYFMNDLQALKTYLKAKASSRGYNDKVEVSGPMGGAIPVDASVALELPPEITTLATWVKQANELKKEGKDGPESDVDRD